MTKEILFSPVLKTGIKAFVGESDLDFGDDKGVIKAQTIKSPVIKSEVIKTPTIS